MSVLVIGSNSFIGATFIDLMLSRGHMVIGVSRSPEVKGPFRIYRDGLKFYRADVNDADKIQSIVDRWKPKIVVNFSAQGMVAPSWDTPEDWMRTNVTALARLIRIFKDVGAFVQMSTPEVFGKNGEKCIGDRFNPETPYATSKAAADMLLMNYRGKGFPVRFVRSSNVYGPGQQLYRFIPSAILKGLLGEPVKVFNDAGVRSWIYCRDVALSIEKAMYTDRDIHVSTGSRMTGPEVLNHISHFIPLTIEEVEGGSGTAIPVGDIGHTPFSAGIQETIKWVRDNLDVLRSMPREYIHRR